MVVRCIFFISTFCYVSLRYRIKLNGTNFVANYIRQSRNGIMELCNVDRSLMALILCALFLFTYLLFAAHGQQEVPFSRSLSVVLFVKSL